MIGFHEINPIVRLRNCQAGREGPRPSFDRGRTSIRRRRSIRRYLVIPGEPGSVRPICLPMSVSSNLFGNSCGNVQFLKPLRYYGIAGTRSSCGECEMHGFAQTFWTKAFSALADKITAEPVETGAVLGVCVRGKIFGLGFVPDGSHHRSRRYDDHINAVNHQFASECLRHSFQPMLRGYVCSEKRKADLAAGRADVDDSSRVALPLPVCSE